MKLTHIMSKVFLTHIVSEAAKTFGKSQDDYLFLGCAAKKRNISLEASGPPASV